MMEWLADGLPRVLNVEGAQLPEHKRQCSDFAADKMARRLPN